MSAWNGAAGSDLLTGRTIHHSHVMYFDNSLTQTGKI